MEQPKFKGFSKYTKTWEYGHGWLKSTDTEAILLTDKGRVVCDIASIGQFTGITLSGKDIYRGDIIQVKKFTFESSVPLPVHLNVEIYKGMYQLYRGNENLMGLHLLYLEEGEVVGTMFENAELVTSYSKKQ